MSDGQDHYRPKSPDLSALNAPPPRRISRLPSIHNPADSSFPQGYQFSPRGSYDASPFFSPQNVTPSSAYFDYQGHSAIPQTRSPSFKAPPLPAAQNTNFSAYQNSGQFYPQTVPDSDRPPLQIQQQPHYSQFPAQQNYFQPFQPHSPDPSQLYGDMARTRQKAAPEHHEPHYGQQVNDLSRSAAGVKVEPMPQHPAGPLPASEPAWHGIDVKTKFPVARIKRIMQADEDVGKVAQATPTAVSKALELFMITLVTKGATEARSQNSKRVTAQHLKAALMKDGQYDFLNEICENVADESSKKGRAKSEAKSEDSDGDIAPKKKGRGGKKRKASSDEDSD